MTTRTVEATAVHTVTVAAAQTMEELTVARDVRDVFDAPTRAVDVAAELSSKMSDETSLETGRSEECTSSTGESTKVWTRHKSNNASTAAFAATQVLAVAQVAQAPSFGSRLRGSMVARLALGSLVATVVAALASYGAVDCFGRGGAKVGKAAAVVQSPSTVETPETAEPTRVALSEQDLTALETAALDALLSGKPVVALLRYRELAARDGGEVFSRVARILEHTP